MSISSESKWRPERFMPLFFIIAHISTGENLKSNTSGVNQPSSTFAACWHHPLPLLWRFVIQVVYKLGIFPFFSFPEERVKAWEWWSERRMNGPRFVPSLYMYISTLFSAASPDESDDESWWSLSTSHKRENADCLCLLSRPKRFKRLLWKHSGVFFVLFFNAFLTFSLFYFP